MTASAESSPAASVLTRAAATAIGALRHGASVTGGKPKLEKRKLEAARLFFHLWVLSVKLKEAALYCNSTHPDTTRNDQNGRHRTYLQRGREGPSPVPSGQQCPQD